MSETKHNPRTDLDRAMDQIRRDYPFMRMVELAAKYNPEATFQMLREILGAFVIPRQHHNGRRPVDPKVAERLTPELLRQIREQIDGNRHAFMEELDYLFLQAAAETMFPRRPSTITIPEDLLSEECAHHNGCCPQAGEPCTVKDCPHPCERAAAQTNGTETQPQPPIGDAEGKETT
ncbi:hypothetical protein HZA86_01660 [Candidatus Uhrbacteria bacterium]|nr:hypothetical protein [Candidatus Uhrbacteria bacterium]